MSESLHVWESVPRAAWISENVDWTRSDLDGRKKRYRFVVVGVEDLLKNFPSVDDVGAKSVLMGTTLVMTENSAREQVLRGRKSYPWDEFWIEVAFRASRGKLPQKLEAGVEDLRQWWFEKWGKRVGRSTVLQRLSRYYKRVADNPQTPSN